MHSNCIWTSVNTFDCLSHVYIFYSLQMVKKKGYTSTQLPDATVLLQNASPQIWPAADEMM